MSRSWSRLLGSSSSSKYLEKVDERRKSEPCSLGRNKRDQSAKIALTISKKQRAKTGKRRRAKKKLNERPTKCNRKIQTMAQLLVILYRWITVCMPL